MKGQSGNPAGRPKGLANRIKEKDGRKAFQVIVNIIEGRIDELGYDAKGERISVAASVKEVRESAKIVLAYTWGTPVSISADDLERHILELEERLKEKQNSWQWH